MDYDLLAALDEAWRRIGPKLANDPTELAARKSRRRLKCFMRPPRAWCLAVRASDRRVTPMYVAMVPDRPVVRDPHTDRIIHREHEVTLDAPTLRWLCRPVAITWPGETVDEIARRIGVGIEAVRRAVKNTSTAELLCPTPPHDRGRREGPLEIRHEKGPSGQLRTILYRHGYFDPSMIPWNRTEDPEWGTMWRFVADHIPPDLSQILVRRPVMRTMNGHHAFRGWNWLCPGCKRLVPRLFYPVIDLVRARFVTPEPDGSPDESAAPQCFACHTCHGVYSFGRLTKNDWNSLVSYLSGGLLYGREVIPPSWYTPRRRRPPRKANRAKGKRRTEVENLLVTTDLSCKRIAAQMGITLGTACGWIAYVYKMNGVHSRQELREKLPTRSLQV